MALISGDWHYLTCIIISADLGRSWKSVNLHLRQSRHLRHLRLKLPCGISSFPNHWFTSHNDKTIPLSHRVGRRLPKQKEKQVNKPSTNIPSPFFAHASKKFENRRCPFKHLSFKWLSISVRWNLWSPTANHPQIQVKAPGWRNCRSLHHRWVAMWRYKTLPFAIRSKFSKPMDPSFQTDFLALSAWCSCGWCWVSFSNKKVLQMGSWSKNSKVLKSGRWEKPKTELNTSTAKMQFRVWVPDFYSIFQGKPPVVAYGPQVLQKSA